MKDLRKIPIKKFEELHQFVNNYYEKNIDLIFDAGEPYLQTKINGATFQQNVVEWRKNFKNRCVR